MNLGRPFDPDAIAGTVASATGDELGYEATRNVVGFDGPRYPVNPNGGG